ncbi:hypothetical protein VB714_06980, partial [Spirulina sp. 06S082]
MALGALSIVLILFAIIPILIRVSEGEISPNSTLFNRLWISTAILGLYNGLSILKKKISGDLISIKLFPLSQNIHTLGLLLLLGVFSIGQQVFYFKSLVQTNIANAEVLH